MSMEAQRGSQLKASAPLPRGKTPGTYCRGRWIAPPAGLEGVWRRQYLLKRWRRTGARYYTLHWFNIYMYILHNIYSINAKYSCEWVPLFLSLFVHHKVMSHANRKSLARSGTRTPDHSGLAASLYQSRNPSPFPQSVGIMCNSWMFNLVVDTITTNLKLLKHKFN